MTMPTTIPLGESWEGPFHRLAAHSGLSGFPGHRLSEGRPSPSPCPGVPSNRRARQQVAGGSPSPTPFSRDLGEGVPQ